VDIRAFHGVRHPELRTHNRFRIGEGLPGIVLQTKKPLTLDNILEDPRALNRAWLEAEGLRAFVGVPLLFRDRCLGVLFAARGGDRPFAQPDVDLLTAFAAHAATAIENARLYERADAEGERLRALVEAMPEAVVVGEVQPGEKDVRLVLANRAHAELLRLPELVGGARTAHYEFLRPDGSPMEDAELELERAIWQGEVTRGLELAVRFPDGSQRVLLANAAPLPEKAGVRQAVAVLQDITDRKRGEEELKRLAEEIATLYEQAARDAQMKGLLLEELTHRVRNNLAVIVSFLELQREGAKDIDVGAVVEDAIARVEGLALVHNVLAGAGFQAGEFGALARGLAEQTLQQGPLAGRVVVCVEGPALPLPSAQLTTLGLATNELFTNIAKHAFPDGRRGRVEVTVGSAGPEATVRVRDDGVGLPPGFAEQPGHLGLKLIRSMVEMTLRGTFALETGEGTTAVIRFPLPGAGAQHG
jgi:PAS domain S-box-containing protein